MISLRDIRADEDYDIYLSVISKQSLSVFQKKFLRSFFLLLKKVSPHLISEKSYFRVGSDRSVILYLLHSDDQLYHIEVKVFQQDIFFAFANMTDTLSSQVQTDDINELNCTAITYLENILNSSYMKRMYYFLWSKRAIVARLIWIASEVDTPFSERVYVKFKWQYFLRHICYKRSFRYKAFIK